MIPFSNIYQYDTIKRIDSPDGRKYQTPSGSLVSSVTTIISQTTPEENKKFLIAWQKRVGAEKAESIRNGAANIGTLLHKNLEQYILGNEVKFGNNMIQKIVKPMYETLVKNGLSKIEMVHGIEKPVFIDELYAGTVDLIAQIDGKIVICDFKNSIKIKKEEWIAGYYLQGSAYAMAFNDMFNENIQDIRIMMVARPDENNECDYKDFHISGETYRKFQNEWLQRLDTFHSQ